MTNMSDIRKMEYRKVTAEEKLHVSRLQNMVFSGGDNENDVREKIAKGEYKYDNTYAAIDENGQVIAGMEIIPYTMWFDGHKVPMYGIGGVASAPEYRRQGNVRGIFNKIFEDIYEQGAVFSHLYPFSYDYYRKFGYEHCGAAKRYTLPLEPARKLKNNGSAHEFIKSDISGVRNKLIEIYELYASRHNLMISRSEDQWNGVFNIGLFGKNRLYYWENADHIIKSWIKFSKKDERMDIHDIAWTDNEGMLGILQFMGMFEGAAEKLHFWTSGASPEFIAELYWNELYEVKTENQWMGMSRIVNVKRALELMKKPEGEGRFVIKVDDDFAEWNSNTYSVEYSGGECIVTVGNINKDINIDIETTERALVLMILGVYELDQIAHRNDVRINGNMQALKKIFRMKNLLLADHF